MSALPDCPKPESWHLLLQDALPREQQEHYESHLEWCSACQELLHQTEQCEGIRTLGQRVGDSTCASADQTLREFLERLQEGKTRDSAAALAPPDLYFLRPSDRPGILGTLGDYEVQEVIGQGGMGIVLKALDPQLHRLVAIKVLAASIAGSRTARSRFTREAQAAASVSHDHIVPVHGVHETAGLPYLVMQYVAGESLQARLDRTGPLEVEEIVRIGWQTTTGLAAAHTQGLIHRDIKPANLMLVAGGEWRVEGEKDATVSSSPSTLHPPPATHVKITDFGLARMVDDAPLTQSGVVAGTPEYMAPEQARGEPVDHRADLFSLGSVLYALSTGVPPFRGATPLSVLRQVSEQMPAPIRALNPDVPAWLETFIARLMAKDPADRFQSASQVASLLEGYLAHLRQPEVSAPELPREDTARKPGRSLPACILALLGFGTSLFLVGDGRDSNPQAASSQEQHLPLRGNPENRARMTVIGGPGAEQCVTIEPEGLRIRLPAGNRGVRPKTGLSYPLAVKGDFEMIVSYEILHEPEQADAGKTTPFYLLAILNRAQENSAGITRRIGGEGGTQFAAWTILWNSELGKNQHNWHPFPASAKKGRLRMVRRDATVSYSVAEGAAADFKTLLELPFSNEDLKEVQIIGYTGGPRAALDVRFTDLIIRSGSLPDAGSAPGKQISWKGWTAAVLLLGLLLSLALTVWLYLRQRPRRPAADSPAQSEASAPLVSFACSHCSQTIKTRAELAGKKVKCPGCGKAVRVSAIRAGESARPL